jgi:hypothetical protein
MPKIGIFEWVLCCITLQNLEGRILCELLEKFIEYNSKPDHHEFDSTYRALSCGLGNKIFQFQVSEFHFFEISLVTFFFRLVHVLPSYFLSSLVHFACSAYCHLHSHFCCGLPMSVYITVVLLWGYVFEY